MRPDDAIDDEMRQRISAAADHLRGEAMAGTDLPWAFFDLGKLSLSIGDVGEALNAYAKAVQLSMAGSIIETAIRSLDRLGRESAASDEIGLARRLLCVGLAARFDDAARKSVV